METIIEACKGLDYSWLPQSVEGFTLVTSSDSDYTELANRIERGEDVLRVPIFHYQNDLGLKKHQDYNGKQCPEWLLEGKYGMDWDWFKEKCME